MASLLGGVHLGGDTVVFMTAEIDDTLSVQRKRAEGVVAGRRIPVGGQSGLRDLLRLFWRQRMVIVSTVLIVTGLVAIRLFQITPQYTAIAEVMLENRQSNIVDIQNVVADLAPDIPVVLSELEVIQSSSLLHRVIDRLGLTKDPEFNTTLGKPPWYAPYLDWRTYVPDAILAAAGLTKRQRVHRTDAEQVDYVLAITTNTLRARLRVRSVFHSHVISIIATSTNPRKAALIANTVADTYITDQLEAKFEATRRATVWLSSRLDDLKNRVRQSEAAVDAYRQQVAGQLGQGSRLTAQQMGELNSQLILAQSERAEAEARLQQVGDLLASRGDVSTAAEVLNSPLIQRLREQEAQVVRKVSELSTRYGERHPAMIDANNELADLRRSIESEVRRIAQGLRNEVQVAQARERTLSANLVTLERRSQAQGTAEIKLNELLRDAEANRLLYENFLSRFKETSEQEDIQQADARIISRAQVPVDPSYPRKRFILMLAVVAAAALGVGLVIVLDQLDNTIRSAEQVETMLGVPAIGMVPMVAGLKSRKNVPQLLAKKPSSTLGEAIRSLRTSILLSNVDRPPRVVAITSTVPGEGKSTLAVWLAQVAAMSGQQVLLIDGDLRRPSIHNILSLSNDSSLVELISGACTAEEVIKPHASGFHVVLGKNTPANPADLFSSVHMRNVIESLRQTFDFVIIDTPPVLAVSDAKVLSAVVDKVLYVVSWDKTSRDLVKTGLNEAIKANLPIAGCVLSKVNIRRHSAYGYGDAGYYYGRYKEYYAS